MNYGKIIGQTWKIIKNTKLLWLLGLMYFMGDFIDYKNMDSLALECLTVSIMGLSLFIMGFSQIGMILCIDKVIRGESPTFKELWHEFKSVLGRSILLSILLLIIFGFIFLCVSLSTRWLSSGSYTATNITTNTLLFLYIFGPVVIGISQFSYYGLILHKMSVFRSLKHGFSVFTLNIINYTVIYLCFRIPFTVSLFVLWIIRLSIGIQPTFQDLFQTLGQFPFSLFFKPLSVFTYLLSVVFIQMVYGEYIKNFDYPTLRQVTPDS